MKHSTVVPRDLVTEFLQNPVNRRVCLPDGSLAIVRAVRGVGRDRLYKVQGIDRDGRFKHISLLSCWFSGAELRLHYYSASIRSDWPRS